MNNHEKRIAALEVARRASGLPAGPSARERMREKIEVLAKRLRSNPDWQQRSGPPPAELLASIRALAEGRLRSARRDGDRP